MEFAELREKAEAYVDEHWNETINEEARRFYGWYDYPKFSTSVIEKMKGLLDDVVLTQEEYNSLGMDDTLMAGSGADIPTDGCVEPARLSVREDCIKFEMKRLQKLETSG
jgi:hypothetical protein